MGATPSKLIPIVSIDTPGSALVPLVTSRAADNKRIYLKSSSTGATFSAYLE
jgi:hypothetical protein